MSFSALMDKLGDLYRQTVTQDNSGASVRTWTKILGDIPVATQPLKDSVRADYLQRQMVVDYSVMTTTDLDNAVGLDSVTVAGPKLGDKWIIAGESYIVRGYRRWGNTAITPESMYESHTQQIRP